MWYIKEDLTLSRTYYNINPSAIIKQLDIIIDYEINQLAMIVKIAPEIVDHKLKNDFLQLELTEALKQAEIPRFIASYGEESNIFIIQGPLNDQKRLLIYLDVLTKYEKQLLAIRPNIHRLLNLSDTPRLNFHTRLLSELVNTSKTGSIQTILDSQAKHQAETEALYRPKGNYTSIFSMDEIDYPEDLQKELSRHRSHKNLVFLSIGLIVATSLWALSSKQVTLQNIFNAFSTYLLLQAILINSLLTEKDPNAVRLIKSSFLQSIEIQRNSPSTSNMRVSLYLISLFSLMSAMDVNKEKPVQLNLLGAGASFFSFLCAHFSLKSPFANNSFFFHQLVQLDFIIKNKDIHSKVRYGMCYGVANAILDMVRLSNDQNTADPLILFHQHRSHLNKLTNLSKDEFNQFISTPLESVELQKNIRYWLDKQLCTGEDAKIYLSDSSSELMAFCERIILYQTGKIKPEDPLFEITGVYSKHELNTYFKSIQNAFSDSDVPVCLELSNLGHAVAVISFKHQLYWIDQNQFGVILNVSRWALVEKIFASLAKNKKFSPWLQSHENVSAWVILKTTFSCAQKNKFLFSQAIGNMKIEKAFIDIHRVSVTKAMALTPDGACWMLFAQKCKQWHLVKMLNVIMNKNKHLMKLKMPTLNVSLPKTCPYLEELDSEDQILVAKLVENDLNSFYRHAYSRIQCQGIAIARGFEDKEKDHKILEEIIDSEWLFHEISNMKEIMLYVINMKIICYLDTFIYYEWGDTSDRPTSISKIFAAIDRAQQNLPQAIQEIFEIAVQSLELENKSAFQSSFFKDAISNEIHLLEAIAENKSRYNALLGDHPKSGVAQVCVAQC
jgi:hypothetical protein